MFESETKKKIRKLEEIFVMLDGSIAEHQGAAADEERSLVGKFGEALTARKDKRRKKTAPSIGHVTLGPAQSSLF